jgi:hypothetical protein
MTASLGYMEVMDSICAVVIVKISVGQLRTDPGRPRVRPGQGTGRGPGFEISLNICLKIVTHAVI